jgi:hypothetical protein
VNVADGKEASFPEQYTDPLISLASLEAGRSISNRRMRAACRELATLDPVRDICGISGV